MAAGVGVVLLAGLIVGLADIVHTGGGVGFAPTLLALWALITLPVALVTGLVLGAGNAQWGPGWVRGAFRRFAEDDQLDRNVSAILIAAAILAGALILVISKLALGLVGAVERKNVGALLLGVVVVGVLPIFALLALPLFRGTRFATDAATKLVPKSLRGMGISVVLLLLLGAAFAVAAAGMFVVFKKLDYQALNLGSLIAPAMIPVVAVVIGFLAYGPLAKVRDRIPSRGIIVAVGAVIAVLLPVLMLRGPSRDTQAAVTERSYIGARIIPLLRARLDSDKDGHSAFFGGPDCDDSRADVHPGAKEIPGNGIDDNCVGGDAKVEVDTPDPTPPTADAGAPTSTLSGGKNVIVIFVDTLRHDRLGFTGYQRDGKSLTPRIDAFANQSIVFNKAFAQAPNTPRSVPSFLSSRYPSQLKVDKPKKSYPTVADDAEMLFEAMKPAGFTTIGQSSHFYFCDRRKYPDTCTDVAAFMNSNVTQGSDLWDNTGAVDIGPSNKDIAGPRIVKKTIAKLEELAKGDQKFAMLVHLFEPHSTYMEHEGFKITERGTASLIQKYDYEIAVTDRHVGELLDTLDKTGLAKTTTVVLMSDHGEAFGVHNFAGQQMFFHGQTLYRELIHVPLIFRVPGAAPRELDDVVELIDLAPTITGLFNVPAPRSWRGRSLVPLLDGKSLPPKPAFGELLPEPKWDHDAKSMISADGKRHVFYRISDSRWEIYDLEKDPDEKRNIADSDPNADALKAQLAEWIEGPLAKGAP